jgi:hypothetical protein
VKFENKLVETAANRERDAQYHLDKCPLPLLP